MRGRLWTVSEPSTALSSDRLLPGIGCSASPKGDLWEAVIK